MRLYVGWIPAAILAPVAGAQTGAPEQKTLTNHDVVVLAKAGFTEEFIIDAILASKSHFDTSPSGLSELAKEATTAFMEAQKKLIDVAGRQVDAVHRGRELQQQRTSTDDSDLREHTSLSFSCGDRILVVTET